MSSTPSEMPSVVESVVSAAVREDLTHIKKNWYWFLILGIALLIIGMAALGSAFVATLATVMVFAWLITISGLIYLIGSFWTRSWGGFFMTVLAGVLSLTIGLIMASYPLQAALIYTLFLAIKFMVEGLLRIIGSVSGRFQNWGWVCLSGVITLLLGIMIFRQWPLSGIWVIGLFVGIDLIFSGWTFVIMGLTAKNLPVGEESSQSDDQTTSTEQASEQAADSAADSPGDS